MTREITLDTLPAYLRGEGYIGQADRIERAGRNTPALIDALEAAASHVPEGSEAHLVCTQMARAIGQTNG